MDRAQAYTLEGIIAAIVIASALVVGLQAVDPAPWTEPDPVDPDDLRTQAQDLLDAASDRDELREAVTCVDPEGDLDSTAFRPGESPLGNLSEQALGTNRHRISVAYLDGEDVVSETVYSEGTPSRISATATRQFALFDNDPLHEYDNSEEACVPQGVTLGELDEDEFYLDNQDDDEERFATVTVRVIVW